MIFNLIFFYLKEDWSMFCWLCHFTVCIIILYLPKNISYLHGLRFSLGVGSGLLPSYYPVIVIAVMSTYYVYGE